MNEINSEATEMRDVFALFGKAYYLSECVHRCLLNIFALGGGPTKTRPEVLERVRVASGDTLGQLVGRAKPLAPERLHPDLDDVVTLRNFLAHPFWHDRMHLTGSTEGRQRLVEELVQMTAFFDRVGQDLDSIFRADVAPLGMGADRARSPAKSHT